MKDKCSVCGKRALIGAIFKCNNCGETFCHRHEKEQFIEYSFPGFDEGDNWHVCYNYPTGESVNRKTFRCYQCRTGKIPRDMGNTKMPFEDYLSVFIVSSIAVFGILTLFTVAGYFFGLSQETCKVLESTCIMYAITVFVSIIIISIVMALYFRRKYKIKHDKML